METTTGYWAKKPDEDGPQEIESTQVMTGVQPFVHDTRNLFLFKADTSPFKERTEDFLASIGYALQRGMQVLFQLEEQEIAVTRIGEKDQRINGEFSSGKLLRAVMRYQHPEVEIVRHSIS